MAEKDTLIILTEGCRLMESPPPEALPVSEAWIKALEKSYLDSNRFLPRKDPHHFSNLAVQNHTSMSNFHTWNVPGEVGRITGEHPE